MSDGSNGYAAGNVGGMLSQPGGVRLNELWYRLAIDNKGAPMYRQRPAPFYPAQVSQGDMGEAQVSPDGRLPYSLRDLSGGGGLAQQALEGDLKRYDRAGDAPGEGCDPSLTPGGPVILSGRMETPPIGGVPPAAGLVGVLWEAQAAAYLTMGRNVYRFDGAATGSWGDLGVGVAGSGPIVAYRGAQLVDHFYQPCGYATPARFSVDGGGTWNPVGAAGGITGGAIQSLVEVDGEVVIATRSPRQGDAMLAVFDDGGPQPTLYNVVDPIGDTAVPISRLVVFNGRVLVVKDREGLFLLNSDRRSMEEELFPEWRGVRIYHLGITVWRGILWVPTSNGLYAVGPGWGLQKVGPSETETSALAPRAPKGPMTAVDGDAYNLYSFRESPDGPSWVYKANVETGGGGVQDIAWYPWSQQLDRQRCRCLAVCKPGAVAGEAADARPPRLLVDRRAQPGTLEPPNAAEAFDLAWYRLPGQGRDPRVDPLYRYAAAGTLYYSQLVARFPAINKAWYSLTPLTAPLERKLDGVTLTAAQGLRLRWKLDVQLPTVVTPYGYAEGSLQRSGVGTRERLNPPLYGRGFDIALRLTTLDDTTSPQVYSVTVEYDLRPTPVWRHEMTLDVSAGAYNVGGAQGYGDPLAPDQALKLLRTMAGASGQLTLLDPWGLGYDVSIPVDGIALRAASGGEAGYGGQIPLLVDVVAVEQQIRDQGTWQSVKLYLWNDLKTITWRQVLQLG